MSRKELDSFDISVRWSDSRKSDFLAIGDYPNHGRNIIIKDKVNSKFSFPLGGMRNARGKATQSGTTNQRDERMEKISGCVLIFLTSVDSSHSDDQRCRSNE